MQVQVQADVCDCRVLEQVAKVNILCLIYAMKYHAIVVS